MTRPKMEGQCCGTCKWLEIKPSNLTNHTPPRWKSGNAVGQCLWPIELVLLPLSITSGRDLDRHRSWMLASQTGCPTWGAFVEVEK